MSGLHISILVLIASLLSGCIAAPIQVASAPHLTPIAKYPPDPIQYQTFLEILVNNVDRAAETAAYRASANDGYLIRSDSWYSDGYKVITLELAVPTYNFENLRSELISLGQVINESLSGKPANPPTYDRFIEYSQITLQLRSTNLFISPIKPSGWDPLRTLQSAWSVFLTIFGFITDILIWILVVAGPFILIALIIRAIIRKRAKPAERPQNSDEHVE